MEHLQCGFVYTNCLLAAGNSSRLWGNLEFHQELPCGPRKLCRNRSTSHDGDLDPGGPRRAGRGPWAVAAVQAVLESPGVWGGRLLCSAQGGAFLTPLPPPGHSNDFQQLDTDTDSQSWTHNQGFFSSKLCSALPVFIRNEKTADPYLFLKRSQTK